MVDGIRIKMIELCLTFYGYLQIYIPKIKWIILLGIFFIGVFYILKKKDYVKQYENPSKTMICGMFWACESSFVFTMTLFGRTVREKSGFSIIPFRSYIASFTEGNMELLLQILMNIVMYIPLGFLLPCCFKGYEKYRYVCITALICSFDIELLQTIFKIGYFEVDDIINNILGAAIGALIYVLFIKLKNIRQGV